MASLDTMIASLERLPQLVKEAAPDVRDAVEVLLREQINAARAPDGAAWPLTQKGVKALPNAVDALRVGVVGPRILAVIKGPDALHSVGWAKGGVRRQMLPDTKVMPVPWRVAIQKVLDVHFQQLAKEG